MTVQQFLHWMQREITGQSQDVLEAPEKKKYANLTEAELKNANYT